MNKRLTRGIGWLTALMMCCLMLVVAPTSAWAMEDNSLTAVYVSEGGDDETGDGSAENPVATLARAVALAAPGTADKPTEIYVMSNLTMQAPARYWNKHIAISSQGKSAPFTVTRGNFTDEAGDPARQGYNAAMIEVNGQPDHGIVSTLSLTNIIFDDNGVHAGKYFIQASSRGTGTTDFGDLSGKDAIDNSVIVQDSMIAVYNGVGRITLGYGAVLKNYGGMSAVRLSGGELVMERGSQIVDDKVVEDGSPASEALRCKGKTIPGAAAGLYGPAGAIWMQGGKLIMNSGSKILNIDGRAVYNESGTAKINGTILGATSNESAMWQGGSGAVMHLRSKATATFGSTARVDGDGKTLKGSGIDVTGGCQLIMEKDSVVTAYSGGNVLNVGGTAYLNGEIFDLTGSGHAICAQNSSNHYICIGKTANIHNNTCGYGVIYTQGSNGVIDIYGKLNDNVSTDRGGALVLANNGSHVVVNMYKGAEMCRNVSYQTGGAVMVSCGTFTMHGGTISDNISGAESGLSPSDKVGGGIYVRRGGQFIMNGGSISDNTSASVGGSIAIEMEDYNHSVPYVALNGGSISGGKMNATVAEADGSYSATEGDSNDITVIGGKTFGHMTRYLAVTDAFVLGNESIFMDDHDLYIENPAAEVKLGNAAADCETAVTNEFMSQYLDVIVGSFWYHSDSAAQRFSLEITNSKYHPDKQLVAAYIATGKDGKPQAEATPKLVPVDVEDKRASLTVPGGGNGYAVVLLQENDDSRGIISIVPADLTAYVGGSDGYESVVVGPEGTTSNSTLPRPVFRVVSSPANTNVEDFIFTNTITDATGGQVSTNSWNLVPVAVVEGGEQYYRFAGTSETTPDVRFQFADANGNTTTDGEFSLEAEQELFKQFRISIFSGATGGQTSTVSVSYNNQPYTPVVGFGELTVRATAEEKPVSSVLSSKPESIDPGKAVAVVDTDTVYTLGGTDVVLSVDKNEGFSPSLLFDGIIDEEDVDRTSALLSRIEGATKDNSQARYLDLVDPNNGNAWIASSKGVTIYWALPEGVPDSAEVSIWHFKGLHRDADGSGFDITEVGDVALDKIAYDREGSLLIFHVGEGGFSPFVLTWSEPGQPVTPPSKHYTITASAGEGGSISPSGSVSVAAGADKTFTFTPDEGNRVADVIVDGESLGALGSYTFEDVRADHTIKVVFKAGNAPADPDDTGVSDWLNTKDHDVYLHGYQDGSNTFKPNGNMTRGEVACMFYNLLLDKSMGDTPVTFEDVPESAFYAEPIRVLASRGILFGTSPTTFAPDRPITRAEFTAIAMRFSKGDLSGENIFVDVSEGAWYYDVIVGSIKYGWIYGYQDGSHRFGPDDTITRAEATCIANRMLGRLPDGAYIAEHKDELKLFSDVSEEHFAWRDIVEATNAHNYVKDGGYEDWTSLKDGADA